MLTNFTKLVGQSQEKLHGPAIQQSCLAQESKLEKHPFQISQGSGIG